MPFMVRAVVASWVMLAAATAALGADDPLARARALYNERQFEAAVNAAEQARLLPSHASAADLVAARAYLESYRDSDASDDLTNARERLRRLNPSGFNPRERVEYIVGLGETLFFDGAFGAAATVFDSVLQGRQELMGDARERVLDWWATAIERDAKARSESDRQSGYQRVGERMEAELVDHADSAMAAYWVAAAARGQGDGPAAWDAAQAAWVRAPLTGTRAPGLRSDLDLLVVRGIAPDRAKALGQQTDAIRLQWEQFKERWKP